MKFSTKFALISYVLINLVQSTTFNVFIDINHGTSLANAIFKILEDFYQFKSPTATFVRVIQPENRRVCNDIIEEVLLKFKKLQVSAEIEDSYVLKVGQIRKRFAILGFIDSTENYLEYLKSLSPERIKFRKYFTIVAIKPLTENELQSIFQSFWNAFVKSVNIINPADNSTIELYTFMPFNEGKCGNTQPVRINIYDTDLQIWRHNVFHPTNKTANLNQCTLILGASIGTGEPYLIVQNNSKGEVKIRGIEKDIFVVFSQVFNFKIKYRVLGSSIGNLYENGTATGDYTSNI